MDGDSDLDLITGGSFPPLFFYENEGDASNPVFTDEPTRLGPIYNDGGADLGFLDRDLDGDFDFAWFSYGWNYPDYYYVTLKAIDNLGSALSPDFRVASWLPWFMPPAAPTSITAGDLNNDGRADLVTQWNRQLCALLNIPGGNFAYDSSLLSPLNALGGHSYPELVDLNSDGDNELVARDSATAQLLAFENIGQPGVPIWIDCSQWLDGLDLHAVRLRAGYLNRDPLIDLIAVDSQFHLSGYLNIGTPGNPAFFCVPAIFADLNNMPFHQFDVADIDGDDDCDLILSHAGSLLFIENQSVTGIENPVRAAAHYDPQLRAYPNPFNSTTRISFTLSSTGHVELAIFDITGRRLVKLANGEFFPGTYLYLWSANGLGDVSGMPSGIYFMRLTLGAYQKSLKIMLLK